MKALRMFLFGLIAVAALALGPAAAAPPGPALLLDINGPIGPATRDYVHRGLEQARAMHAQLVVLQMDTPGGLDTSMREIIQDIIASPVPVVTFVAPSGARAASAGTYILYASEIAAMAPGTNVGAATPVQLGAVPGPGEGGKPGAKGEGGAMEHKILNDAVAYIRSLAQMRGRNAEWAQQAVRRAATLTAEEAVRLKVADLMANDVGDLLAKLNGRSVSVHGRRVVLHTTGIEVVRLQPDWRNRLLSVITDPNVAYILMLLGIYGLFFELWNPGYVLPGVIGGISLLLALYAFHVLPISYAGLGLILLGIAFMVAEVFVSSFGALGIGGIVAFVVGSIILMDRDVPGFGIAWPLIAAVTVFSAAFFIGVVSLVLKARRRRVVSGKEELLGGLAIALEAFDSAGRVRIHSEEWQARSAVPVQRGQRLKVTGMDGLVLLVEPQQAEDS